MTFRGCSEAAMASEAVRGNMHMDTIALVDSGIIGPLPSCFMDKFLSFYCGTFPKTSYPCVVACPSTQPSFQLPGPLKPSIQDE